MRMKYRGDWQPNARYQPGDVVAKGRRFLVVNHVGKLVDVASPADPSCIGPPGRDGIDGERGADGRDGRDGAPSPLITPAGDWRAGKVYPPLSIVSHDGSSYLATAEVKREPPGKGWQLLAARGDDGERGRDGHSYSYARIRHEIVAGPKLSMTMAEIGYLGNVVYATADGLAGLAQANADPHARAIGLLTADTALPGWPAQIATSGLVSGLSGLVPGAVYYLSPDVPGGMTTTCPTSDGQYVIVIGIATSETEFNLQIAHVLRLGS